MAFEKECTNFSSETNLKFVVNTVLRLLTMDSKSVRNM